MSSLPKDVKSETFAPVKSAAAAAPAFDWAKLMPTGVTYADALSPKETEVIWEAMYAESGISSATLEKKAMFRGWAYVTGVLNGTSRSGDYATTDQLADGTDVATAVIPRHAGRNLRKFFRGNMDESYYSLKSSGIIQTYKRHVERCGQQGIAPEQAFATADWLDGCPHFTPLERRAHEKSRAAGLSRARRARDGKTLEHVEDLEYARGIRVNGPDATESDVVEF